MDCWIPAADISNVALKVLHVDNVEADDRLHVTQSVDDSATRKAPHSLEEEKVVVVVETYSIQPHITLCQPVAIIVRPATLRQIGLCAVEGLEQRVDVLFVGFLRPGNP